jgi:hypothetical protein
MGQVNNPKEQGLSMHFRDELSKNLTIHTRLNQEIIITTADKIMLVLKDTREVLISQRDWWTPFGLLVSLITTLCTAEFKTSFGMSKEFWHAVFILLALLSSFWLIKTFLKLVKNWGQDDLNKILERLKVQADNNTSPIDNSISG